MARQLTTRAQVNGYRFLLRRLDHALIRRDVRMLHDPMRSQGRALAVGAVLGVLVLAAFVLVERRAREGWALASEDGLTVAVTTELDDELRRKGRVYIINKQNPRFKARQG